MATHTICDCKINIEMPTPEKGNNTLFDKFSSCKNKCSQPLEVFLKNMLKLGRDDPRRVIHALKVGLALSVVSLFYLMETLFERVGDNAIWAIMTVVVVFEFTAGATLSKGLNRGIGTFIAGLLAVSVGYIADNTGKIGEPIFIGSSCFIVGGAATFFRFLPEIKVKYDYGVLIFILTFNMIIVSGYRVENIFRMVYQRLSTIAIGCAVSVVVSLCICPIWAGEDLHRSTIKRIHGLADSLEGCMVEYFEGSQHYSEMNEDESGKIVERCKDVLESKASEESLANFASWEPAHGMFGFRHPWKQYAKIGSMLRHMTYCIVGLHCCLGSEYQAPDMDTLALENPSTYIVGMEVAKILHELAESIKCMRQCPPKSILHSLHDAVDELYTSSCFQPKIWYVIQPRCKPMCTMALKAENRHANPTQQDSQTEQGLPQYEKRMHEFEDNVNINSITEANGEYECNSEAISEALKIENLAVNKGEENHVLVSMEPPSKCFQKAQYCVELSEEVPLAAFASLLIEIVGRLEHVIEAVHELGRLAGFKQ